MEVAHVHGWEGFQHKIWHRRHPFIWCIHLQNQKLVKKQALEFSVKIATKLCLSVGTPRKRSSWVLLRDHINFMLRCRKVGNQVRFVVLFVLLPKNRSINQDPILMLVVVSKFFLLILKIFFFDHSVYIILYLHFSTFQVFISRLLFMCTYKIYRYTFYLFKFTSFHFAHEKFCLYI